MKHKIGFVASAAFHKRLRKQEFVAPTGCEIIYLPYDRPKEIIDILQQYKDQLDCFLFSGGLLYYYVNNHVEGLNKPLYYVSISKETVYKELLKQFKKNKNTDISKIYLDFLNQSNDFMGLREIYPKMKYFYDLDSPDYDLATDLQLIQEQHVRLHLQNKISLSMTSLGEIVTPLKQQGIKVKFITPDPSDIIHVLTSAMDELTEGPKAAKPVNVRIVSKEPAKDTDKTSAPSPNASLSNSSLKKLLALLEQLATNQLSSEDLSKGLEITSRSANRILRKLTQSGQAQVINLKSETQKGRPMRIYEIHL